MTHAHKERLARTMSRTVGEKKFRTSLFQTEAWTRRADAIRLRVKKQQDAAHERALIRKGLKKEGFFAKRRRLASIKENIRAQAARRARRERFEATLKTV